MQKKQNVKREIHHFVMTFSCLIPIHASMSFPSLQEMPSIKKTHEMLLKDWQVRFCTYILLPKLSKIHIHSF